MFRTKILAILLAVVGVVVTGVLGEATGGGGLELCTEESILHLDHELPEDCIGDYVEETFQKLQGVCESCYRAYKSEDLYDECRHKCFTSEQFGVCAHLITDGKLVQELEQLAIELKGVRNHPVFIADPNSELFSYIRPDDCLGFHPRYYEERMLKVDLICKLCGKKHKDKDIYNKCRNKCYTSDVFLNCGKDLGLKYPEMDEFHQFAYEFYGNESENYLRIKRQIPDECRGLFVEEDFVKLQKICDDCLNLYKSSVIYGNCRKSCFTTDGFELCAAISDEENLKHLKRMAIQLRGGENTCLRVKREIPMDCQGSYTPYEFQRLQTICEKCFELYRDVNIYHSCRKDCFTSEVFSNCTSAALFEDQFKELNEIAIRMRGEVIETEPVVAEMIRHVPAECHGPFVEENFKRLQEVCETCYRFFDKNMTVYNNCRHDCYTSSGFSNCTFALLSDDYDVLNQLAVDLRGGDTLF